MEGGKDGAALSATTVGHAHRVLHRLLVRAVKDELIARNVAAIIKPPKPSEREIEILAADQLTTVLGRLNGHELEPIAVSALGSGARRGELLALTRGHINLDKGTMRIERSLEQTRAGLKFKTPKTKNSRRTISLPPVAVEALRAHLLRQLETRMALGQGKPDGRALVFSKIDGSPIPPNDLSRDWRRFIVSRKLPAVTLHGLRHTHVSALISRGVDVLTISRRIGHANAAITLRVYGHLFEQNDGAAVNAIEAALRGEAR
jgi:integrase